MDERVPMLRVATVADRDDIDRVMKASTAAIFPAYYTAEQTASSVRFVAEPDPMLLADGTYYVLEVDGEIVGCGGWSRRARPYAGSAPSADDDRLLDPATEPAHVRAMFVTPNWTRRGLGRRILERCESDAARQGFRRLDLVATLPGVPLYEAFGFVAVGPVEDIVLTDGALLPCVSMTKVVSPRSETPR